MLFSRPIYFLFLLERYFFKVFMHSSDTRRVLLNCSDKVMKKIVQNYTFALKSSLSFVDVVTGPCTATSLRLRLR